MFKTITGYENIESDTKIVLTKEKKMKKSATSLVETESTGKNVTEPFTMLLMGIDSTDEVLSKNAVANGDTLILITFNPKTLNATMLSVPRDSYVPIACWSNKAENKITHAAGYGNDCMINTIEDYFDINQQINLNEICDVKSNINKKIFVQDLKKAIIPLHQIAYNQGFIQLENSIDIINFKDIDSKNVTYMY